MRQQWISKNLGAVCAALSLFCILGVTGCGDSPPASIPVESPDSASSAGQSDSGSQVETVAQPSVGSPLGQVPDGPIAVPLVKKEYELKPVTPEVLVKTNHGDIRIRLDYDKAPQTVGNFLGNYVDKKFYDDTVFHYVDKGFIAIAGGFTTDYEPKETKGYVNCESDNGLKNLRATVAMTRLPDYADSGTSQFFFNLADNAALDFQGKDSPAAWGYCVFGEVIEGMDVVERIASLPVSDRPEFPKCPTEPVTIQTIERIQ